MVDVVVLSAETALFEAIRSAIGERNPVWRARTTEESVDLLMTSRCGVLVVDTDAVSIEVTTLIEQIAEQFPEVVMVVAGRREDEAPLARLVSEGLVYRFMHKPLSAKRAGMFLGASIRHHVERRESRVPASRRPRVARLQARVESRKWLFVATGLGLFVAAVAVFLGSYRREAAPAETASTPRVAAPAPRPTGPQADPVLARARAALAGGRYESPAGRNALDLYAAVLLARPDHAEARAGLDKTIGHIVAEARQTADTGRKGEANRLLQRVLAVDPHNGAATALSQKLRPRPAPSLPEAAPVTMAPTPAPAPAAKPATPATLRTATPPIPPAVPAVTRPTPIIVTRDPLTPRIVNADAMREAARTRLRAARAVGPPAASGHPIAGYVEPAPEESRAEPVALPEVPAAARAAVDASGTSLDTLQPLVTRDPVYPAQALRNGIEGWVQMEFTITETGTVRDVEVLGSAPRGIFDTAATEAIATWRFRPRVVNGRPVAQRSDVTLRFNVDR